MYVYAVMTDGIYGPGGVEKIFDSVDKAINYIDNWDIEGNWLPEDFEEYLIYRDETRGEGVEYVRTIDYSAELPDERVDIFIVKFEVE